MKKFTYLLFIIFFLFVLNTHAIIQRVRINFTGPDGITRFLLLGFTSDNAASDAFDYGYDALNIDNLPNDLNWMIDDQRYVIQGVGAYDIYKFYRLGMFLENSGSINISLNSLENFDTEIPVYVYDMEENTFTQLNSFNFSTNLQNGNYVDRFYLTFSNNSEIALRVTNYSATLSIPQSDINEFDVTHYKSTNQLVIEDHETHSTYNLSLYDLSGKLVYQKRVSNISTLDTHLSPGVYALHISSNYTRREFRKIISL